MTSSHRRPRGMALMSVLVVVFVLTLVGALTLYLTGRELAGVAMRLSGAQSLNVAEGGAVAARSALMALFNADPVRSATAEAEEGGAPLPAAFQSTLLEAWYAGGVVAAQNAFAVLNHLTVDGQALTVAATAATASVTLEVDWTAASPRLKLRVATGAPPANPLGAGTYRATVTLARRLAPHPYDPAQPQRYVQRLGAAYYEFYYRYTIVSDGAVSPMFRRRVEFSGDFSTRVRRASFAEYALFTNLHMTPNTQPTASCTSPPCPNSPIWFTNRSNFDGPVHTNGQFRFAFFPKFGTPDSQTPCSQARVRATSLTSVSATAWFNNNGSPVERAANENVVSGVRRDAPVLPDCTPGNTADDNTNPPANFTRGVAAIPMPTSIFSQQGVAVGRDPADLTPVTNLRIRQAIAELANNTNSIPTGIYVPVADANGNGVPDAGEALAGGIYVQGDLTSLTLSVDGSRGRYTLVQGSQTVTVSVDRSLNQTIVTNSLWPSPQTRTFAGVPKGWQQPDPDLTNATLVFVNGHVLALGGTLQQNEQATIVATGRIDITNHIRYQTPPDPHNPASNPVNLLGLYSVNNDIRIRTSAPDDLDLHAVLMAGTIGDGYESAIVVENYRSRSASGYVNLIGGTIAEYYGAFGTFHSSTGAVQSGYGRNFVYDRRMGRGFSPPYFPTINAFGVATHGLAGARPVWREVAP